MDIDSVLFRLTLTAIVHSVLAVLASLHAMMNKRDPRSAIGWIAVCILFPLAGPVLYFFFGINRVRLRARNLRFGRGLPTVRGSERPPTSFSGTFPLSDPPAPFSDFYLVSENVTRRPVSGANFLKMFEGGEEAYPPMLEAIARARESVYLSTYIFRMGETGGRFIRELGKARQRGVDVRVIIDGLGGLYSLYKTSAALRRAKIPVAHFLPPRIWPPTFSINLRNHRKILSVDGEKAFLGGMNIADNHLSAGEDSRRMRDVHFGVEGSVVRHLEHVFLEDWHFTSGGTPPQAPEPFTADPWEPVSCRTITDGPDENLDKLHDIVVGAISAARKSVIFMTPYFLPPLEMISALNSAALRGVEVIIILPGKNNLPYVHWATRNLLWELLIREVKVYYQPPPFVHSKLFVADDHYSLIGSANMDPRSLRLNFEIGMEIFDSDFSSDLADYCREAANRSRMVTLDDLDARSLPAQMRDAFFWLFSPYL